MVTSIASDRYHVTGNSYIRFVDEQDWELTPKLKTIVMEEWLIDLNNKGKLDNLTIQWLDVEEKRYLGKKIKKLSERIIEVEV